MTVKTVAALFAISFATAEAAQKTLSWDPSTEEDVAGYRVHYGTTSGQYDKMIDVGSATTATITDLTPGISYAFVVTAYNSAGLESVPSNEAFIQVPADVAGQAPVVTLTSPTAGAAFSPSTPVTLTAEASDSDGSVTKVEFYANGEKVGEDVSAPFSATWTPSGTANFLLSARVTYDNGTTATSGTVSVTVNDGTDVNERPEKAKFTGILSSSDSGSLGAGMIKVKTNRTGGFSGKLMFSGKSYKLKGRFNADGSASVSIPRANATPLTVQLQAGTMNSDGELSGTVTDGTTVVEIAGDRAVATDGPSIHKGKWTILLESPEAQSGETPTAPQTGHGTISVGGNGSARFSGTLADGSTFSYGAFITQNNQMYIYAPLYGKRGALAGVLRFESGEATDGKVTGSVRWIKPEGASKGRLYPDGFEVELNVEGERHRRTGESEPESGFPSTSENSTITLSGGNLARLISKTVSISRTGRVVVTDPGVDRLKLTMNLKAGTFSGSFLDVASGQVRRFSGAVLQGKGVGAGSFQGIDQSGSVTLQPKQ